MVEYASRSYQHNIWIPVQIQQCIVMWAKGARNPVGFTGSLVLEKNIREHSSKLGEKADTV